MKVPKEKPSGHNFWRFAPWLLLIITSLVILPGLTIPLLSIDEPTTIDGLERIRIHGSLHAGMVWHLDGYLFIAIQYLAEILFGKGIFALRLPAALAAILSSPLLFYVLRSFFSVKRSFWYSLLFSVSPIALYYAKEARAYSLLNLFYFVFLYCYMALKIRISWLRLLLIAAAAFLLVSVHSVGIFYLGGFFACLLLYRLKKGQLSKFRKDFFYGIITLAVITPLILYRFFDLRSMPNGYLSKVHISLIRVLTEELVFINPNGLTSNDTVNTFILCLLFIPIILQVRQNGMKVRKPGFLIFWIATPLLAKILEMIMQTKILYYPRAYMATLPFALIFLGENLLQLTKGIRRNIYLFALLTFFSFFCFRILFNFHQEYEGRKDLRRLVASVENATGNRRVLIHHFAMAPYFKANFMVPERILAMGRSNSQDPFDYTLANSLREIRNQNAKTPFALVINRLSEFFNDPDHLIEKTALSTRIPTKDLQCANGNLKIVCERILVFDEETKPGVNLLIASQVSTSTFPITLKDLNSKKECVINRAGITACGPFKIHDKYDMRLNTVGTGLDCKIFKSKGVFEQNQIAEIVLKCEDRY